MTSKVIGTLMIAAVVGGIIFIVKFLPFYNGASEIEEYFNYCMSNFQMRSEGGCREDLAKIIEKNNLNLSPESIVINCQVGQSSVLSADWDETIDFFGVYQYTHSFHRILEGVPPQRR